MSIALAKQVNELQRRVDQAEGLVTHLVQALKQAEDRLKALEQQAQAPQQQPRRPGPAARQPGAQLHG